MWKFKITMEQKETIIELLESKSMKQRELAESIYGEENHTLNILDELKKLETEEIIIRHDDRHTYDSLTDSALSVSQTSQSTMLVPRPTVMEVEKYLQEWANLESYKL